MRTLHPGIARALIRAGADVNVTDEQGRTCLMKLSAWDAMGGPDGPGARRGGGVHRAETLQALVTAGEAAETPERDQPIAPLHEGMGKAHIAITTSSEIAQTSSKRGS